MRSIEERFFEKLSAEENGCGQWLGAKGPRGYGYFVLGGRQPDERLAHRVAYRLFVGDIPRDREIDHLCKNPSCVNPNHLRIVDHVTNMQNGYFANKTHCPQGHPYDLLNTGWRENDHPNGQRTCRACNAAGSRRWRAQKKAVIA